MAIILEGNVPSDTKKLMGFALTKVAFIFIRAPHVHNPSCSGKTLSNLILQSVSSLPNALNLSTARSYCSD